MQERREWNTRLDIQNLERLGYMVPRRWSTESSNLDIAIQSAASPSSACARTVANHSARFAFKLPTKADLRVGRLSREGIEESI